MDSVLAEAINETAKRFADAELRATYQTLDAAALIRQSALAEGAERLARILTKEPSATPSDSRTSR